MVTLHFPLSSHGAVNASSSACLSHPAARPHVFIVDCHLSVKNAFVSIFSLCKLLIFLLLHLLSSPSQFSPRRFIARHWQQQRGGFIWALSLKRDVTKPHSLISTSSDSALDTFSHVLSALIMTVFIKGMNHSGAWADLQVRAPSWSWRLHEIAIYDLHEYLYGPSWSLNDNRVSIFCLHRERAHIRFHRPSWIIAFPPLFLQKNGWSPANLVQHLKRMPSWHLSAVVWAFLRLAFSCSIWLRLTNCCCYLLCSPQSPILFPPTKIYRW